MIRQEILPRSTIEILNSAKGSDSDDVLATRLGVKRSYISMWRSRRHIGPEHTARLAELAGIDVGKALALCAIEGVKDAEARANLLQKLDQRYNADRADVAQSVEQLIRNQ